MLICLFFTVRSDDDDEEVVLKCNQITSEEKCKEVKEQKGQNCCWVKWKAGIIDLMPSCEQIKMEEFEETLETAKETYEKVSIDCSGKYLYVASLLLLLFVF